MDLQQRLDLLQRLGNYILSGAPEWNKIKEKAYSENAWFTPEFIEVATHNIAKEFLEIKKLRDWAEKNTIPKQNVKIRNIGIVMAGNIPLVGFHDFLSAFISGHKQTIKLSSKDNILLPHLVDEMISWNHEVATLVAFADQLKRCDAYIATGTNNSARYFDYYLGKYPNIIRRNRTSVAILTSYETVEELQKLADDVYFYFGLGCRNVTKIYVPEKYDFLPLLTAFKKYDHLADHHKYKNNYDYQLAILLINKHYYMTNGSVILHENKSVFSPISQLNYEFYTYPERLTRSLKINTDVQCVVGKDHLPFGDSQKPGLSDFADGINSLQFLLKL
jgi:hypothetical protein